VSKHGLTGSRGYIVNLTPEEQAERRANRRGKGKTRRTRKQVPAQLDHAGGRKGKKWAAKGEKLMRRGRGQR
jgi:hypothetical protein